MTMGSAQREHRNKYVRYILADAIYLVLKKKVLGYDKLQSFFSISDFSSNGYMLADLSGSC